ncbi:ATP-binding cassette domain-containing protein [Paenibacillus amylolyticus]|nr:ATP-binding cassette domain-containing protein [Paenibacillus amylolyticus]WFR61357.1 ATP-binding cassette domain-containing protein [Paenibacillus amylolyticus]
MPSIQGDVLFEHVQFGYEENQLILDDIGLHARPGQTIAIIGVSGAGKSTLVNLLGRHYDVQDGSIFIDGIDIRTVSPHSLRSQISVVLQDTFLFAGTIRENIRFGKLDATDAEIEEVSKIVCIHDTILSLPQGYDTELQEQGLSLSIGERQLVSFARALLSNPRILILDEATANVDTETELKIRAAMDIISNNRTTFVIAHRLSTIRYADQIIVMDRGRIVESGTHNELMDIRGIYHNYVRKQNMNLSSKV